MRATCSGYVLGLRARAESGQVDEAGIGVIARPENDPVEVDTGRACHGTVIWTGPTVGWIVLGVVIRGKEMHASVDALPAALERFVTSPTVWPGDCNLSTLIDDIATGRDLAATVLRLTQQNA
jgi:hypothetical protein